MQTYIRSDEITPENKRSIFKYRTKMEMFGENFVEVKTQLPALCLNFFQITKIKNIVSDT